MSVKIRTSPEIRLRSRLEVLHGVIKELTVGFLGDLRSHEDILKTLQKGIVERQLLASINFEYLNSNEEIEGIIEIKIDWNQHQIFARKGDGKEFLLDKSTSIRDQISTIYSLLLQHTDEMKKALEVVEIKVYYRYRPEIANDKEKDAEADSFLGLCKKISSYERSKRELGGESIVKLEYCSRNLKELKINIEHKRPR